MAMEPGTPPSAGVALFGGAVSGGCLAMAWQAASGAASSPQDDPRMHPHAIGAETKANESKPNQKRARRNRARILREAKKR
jgi:hypothetical protein